MSNSEIDNFMLKNIELTEKIYLRADEISSKVYEILTEKIEEWLSKQEIFTGYPEKDELKLAPEHWNNRVKNKAYAYFTLNGYGDVNFWQSHAVGMQNSSLGISFALYGFAHAKKMTWGQLKSTLVTFFENNPKLQEMGFSLSEDNYTIILPFTLEKETFIHEYPNLEECLSPLYTSLKTIAKALPYFDEEVKRILKHVEKK